MFLFSASQLRLGSFGSVPRTGWPYLGHRCDSLSLSSAVPAECVALKTYRIMLMSAGCAFYRYTLFRRTRMNRVALTLTFLGTFENYVGSVKMTLRLGRSHSHSQAFISFSPPLFFLFCFISINVKAQCSRQSCRH